MQRIINNIKLYVKENNRSQEVYNLLNKELNKYQFKIVDDNFDLGISIGGDGTFLKMIHDNNFNENCYYIGINTGTLGYLPEINPDNLADFVNKLHNNRFHFCEWSYLKTVVSTKEHIDEYYSLNEIVLRNSDLSVLRMQIYLNNHLFEDFIGDGVILNTPIGSTAYNMSLNGAIIDNSLKVLSIVPIAPINNRVFKTLTNPLILPEKTKVSFTFPNKNSIIIMRDGTRNIVDNVQRVSCTIDGRIKCLTMDNKQFVDIINDKIRI